MGSRKSWEAFDRRGRGSADCSRCAEDRGGEAWIAWRSFAASGAPHSRRRLPPGSVRQHEAVPPGLPTISARWTVSGLAHAGR